MEVTIIQSHQNWWDKAPRVTEHKVEGDTVEDIYAHVFREHDNRFKYCNGSHFAFKDAAHAKPYRDWVGVTENYAANGGDMW